MLDQPLCGPVISMGQSTFEICCKNSITQIIEPYYILAQRITMPGFEKFTFFVHEAHEGENDENETRYQVSEFSTGRAVLEYSLPTIDIAVATAFRKLLEIGIDRFTNVVDRYLQS